MSPNPGRTSKDTTSEKILNNGLVRSFFSTVFFQASANSHNWGGYKTNAGKNSFLCWFFPVQFGIRQNYFCFVVKLLSVGVDFVFTRKEGRMKNPHLAFSRMEFDFGVGPTCFSNETLL